VASGVSSQHSVVSQCFGSNGLCSMEMVRGSVVSGHFADRRTEGWEKEKTDGRTEAREKGRQTEGREEGQTDGSTGGRKDGQTDGRTRAGGQKGGTCPASEHTTNESPAYSSFPPVGM
jgi:hypothetical protein